MGYEHPAALIGGVALLERAISYTLSSLHLVTPQSLREPTPCRDWDLRALLVHMNDSMLALHQAVDIGQIAVEPPPGDDGHEVDLVATLKSRTCQLLGAWTSTAGRPVAISGTHLTASIISATGAVEVAVHGWDVAQSCGQARPIPEPLAEELLDLVPLLVTDSDRPGRFAPAVPVSPLAPAGDRLVAFLGRRH